LRVCARSGLYSNDTSWVRLRTPSFEKALSRWVRKTHLFSNVPVFLPEAGVGEMLRVVHAVEAATRLPGYRHAVLSLALDIARHDFGPVGVFMGYDFHLAADGPRLIEVNTNAGGAFLNALLAKAQRACCKEVEVALGRPEVDDFEPA
jgi:hypothetical protein